MAEKGMGKGYRLLLALLAAAGTALGASPLWADEAMELDEISVTATRMERPTKDVPQAIAVVGKREIEERKMLNLKEGLDSTPGVLIESGNAGYDARLIIRGAGLKARYGIREIMLLRDGVPMTDPDSFTRLDFVDTQDIEQIEVVKGPGSIYAAGSAGGTIHVISKSVFDLENSFKLGGGNHGQLLAHGRVGGMIGESQAISLTATHKRLDNDWRQWNKFESSNFALKHGIMLSNSGVLESEIAYTEADLQLSGRMDEIQFADFKVSGRQDETADPWKHSGRYSKIVFANLRYEQELGDWTIKPRFYGTWWEHYHPVTGFINDSQNNFVFGTDLEGQLKHRLAGREADLVLGATVRRDISNNAEKYSYRDTVTASGRIVATASDQAGDLAQVQDTYNTIYGVFLQESVRLADTLLLDLGFRLDRSEFDISATDYIAFNYAMNNYTTLAAPSESGVKPGFTLFSPKAGLSWSVRPGLSLYGSVAQAGQVPSSSEITSNPDLDSALATSYEIGAKGRYSGFSFDLAAYYSTVEDEIVQQYQDGESVYRNAGETRKRGIEFNGVYEFLEGFSLGGGYAFSDYEFKDFSEIVRGFAPGVGMVTSNEDRAGNALPYIPRHQYSLFAAYRHPAGFRARIETQSWGKYWMDNANTEKYEGYELVTNLMVGYQRDKHSLQLNVDNLFDKYYAVEATKDLNGDKRYRVAMPRSWMLTYQLRW